MTGGIETTLLDLEQPANSAAAERFDLGAGLEPLEYIDHIFERELKLTLRGVELGSERDDSMRELTETAASLYDGRIIRELIQNAYDGSGDDPKAEILVRLDLSVAPHGVLDVANSGSGFLRADVDSIANPARSRKRPGNAIGHKGLGFRSVTLISDNPQVYSSRRPCRGQGFDGYCFRFATVEDQLARLMELGSEADARCAAGKADNTYLFPVGTAHKSPPVLSQQIRWTIADWVGEEMTAHQFRHFACLMMPDEPEVLAELLGHHGTETVRAVYREFDTLRAGRRFDAIIEAKIAKARSPRRRR
jgi:hypothetical protein